LILLPRGWHAKLFIVYSLYFYKKTTKKTYALCDFGPFSSRHVHDRDELIRFRGQKIKGEGHNYTNYGQKTGAKRTDEFCQIMSS